jgi:hypothetical protein
MSEKKILPVESVAREWWGNSSARSSEFSTAGTVGGAGLSISGVGLTITLG